MASRFAARTETKTPRGSTADDREQHRDDCASVRRVEERKAVSGMDSEHAGGMLAEARVVPTTSRANGYRSTAAQVLRLCGSMSSAVVRAFGIVPSDPRRIA